MASFITASFPAHLSDCHRPFSSLNSPSRIFPAGLVICPPKRQHLLLRPNRKRVKQGKQNQLLFEFSDYCGVVRMCMSECEREHALEMELFEFMKNSKNPKMFPFKSDLIECGRADLAEAIEKIGGWMSMGWENDVTQKVENEDGLVRNSEFSFDQDGSKIEVISRSELNGERDPEGISCLSDSSPAASSFGRSLEMGTKDESGVEGILNRLERQRNLNFGLNLKKNGGLNHVSVDTCDDEQCVVMPKNVDNSFRDERKDPGSLQRQVSGRLNRPYVAKSSTVPAWRTFSSLRAANAQQEFEAAEIDYRGNKNGRTAATSAREITVVTNNIKEPLEKTKDSDSSIREFNQSSVKNRLEHLELELSSVLRFIRSNKSGLSQKAKEHMSEGLRQISDASEFEENKIMNAQEKLRSLRAKVAILEGKMTLAIIDAQKVLDEKQMRIDNARRPLQLLRSTCIVWSNFGSEEVLLSGSFDGWFAQRKMEKLSSGLFFLSLKLYPGRYEIKFIVDGSWKVDPLRPIVVNNGGFENNLFIVT